MKTLFHHAYDIICENGAYRPTRFTDRQLDALEALNPSFRNLGRCSAGVSLAMVTDAEVISFTYTYTPLYTRVGGFDVYENGILYKTIPLPTEACTDTFTYRKESAGETSIEIFLPHNAEMILSDFSLGNWRPIAPADGKMILWLGDSITQCAYISTPSLNYAGLTSRAIGADYLNRGVGSLFYDATELDEADTVKPDIIVVELGANDLVKHDGGKVVTADGIVQFSTGEDVPMLIGNARAYLEKLKKIFPQATIYVQSILYAAAEKSEERLNTQWEYVAALKALTDALGLSYIDAWALTPHIRDAHAGDGIHLSALGNVCAAQKLTEILK